MRDLGAEPRAAAARALERESPLERFDAVGESAQARSLRVRAAYAVVGDRHRERSAVSLHLDAHGFRPCVLRHVRERLGHEEVRGRLDRVVAPFLDVDPQVDRHRQPLDERLEGSREAAVGEYGGMDPAGQVAQFAQARVQVIARSGKNSPRTVGVAVELLLQHRQLERRGHQPLLCSIVQVALDPATRLVGRRDQANARRGELVARLGVLDGVGDELRELSDPVLGRDRHLEDLGGRWLARDQNGHTLQRRVLANELLERPAARGSVHRPTLTEVVESAAMSRVVVINHLTLDGVMQGPGRPDEDTRDGFDLGGWAGANVDDVVNAAVGARRPQSGGMLLGRRSYEDMLGYWNTQDSPFKDMLNDAPKYVASRTLSEPLPWPNSTLLTGGVAESVAQLKQESGRDLNVMGSGELIRR